MDQDKFCDLGNVDEDANSEIDLTQAPTSGESYLRQVILGRSRCQSIVVADRDFSGFTSKRTLQIPRELLLNDSSIVSSINFPPESWRRKQTADFERLRWRLNQKREEILKRLNSKIKFPPLNNEAGWKKFCFEKCSPQFDGDSTNGDLLKLHKGTPPLLPIVLSLTAGQVADLFEFQVGWFVEEGFSIDRVHWLYALISVLEKPLTPECSSALRDLAREFAKLRKSIAADSGAERRQENEEIIKASNLFLCLIVDYFNQKDLADW